MPCKDCPHHEVEIVVSFKHFNVFKPIEHREGYHIRKRNDENFLFEIEDKKLIYVGEKVITNETIDEILNFFSELGFNDVKYPYAYGENNIHFMLHRKYIPIQEYKISTLKNEYQYSYKKGDEYGNEFINCKIIIHENSK